MGGGGERRRNGGWDGGLSFEALQKSINYCCGKVRCIWEREMSRNCGNIMFPGERHVSKLCRMF